MNDLNDLAPSVGIVEKTLKRELIETSILITGMLVVIWVAYIGIAHSLLIIAALAVLSVLFVAMVMSYRNLDGARLKVLTGTVGVLLLSLIIGLARIFNYEMLAMIKMPLELILFPLMGGIVILMLMLANLYISRNTLRKIKNYQQKTVAGTEG